MRNRLRPGHDRRPSLPIHLKRKTPSEKVERFRERKANLDAAPLREQLTAWVGENIDALAEARPELPEELDDRAQDVVEPLLAIADAAGGEWPERARKALVELRGQGDVGDEPDAIRLLTDIRTVFTDQEEMHTTYLLYALFDIDTSPWAHWWGETRRGEFGETSIEPNRAAAMKLARTLRPFGIRPVSLGGRVRGYRHVDLEEPFERYLPSPEGASPPSTHPEVVKVVQTQQTSQESDISRSSKDGSNDNLQVAGFGSITANGRPLQPQTPDKGKSTVNGAPEIGDDDYLPWLFALLEAELITEEEWHRGSKAHRRIVLSRRSK